MVTYTKEVFVGRQDRVTSGGLPIYYREGSCLSTDTKPTDCENGSVMLEMDTSKMYMYDAANAEWKEWT